MRSTTDHQAVLRRLSATALVGMMLVPLPVQGWALSELGPGRKADSPVASDKTNPDASDVPRIPSDGLPSPDPLINEPDADEETVQPTTPAAEETPDIPVEVLHDINSAPEPVRRMRQLIVEAAASGDISRLKPLLNPGPNQTQVMTPDTSIDPIEAVKALSGDPEGMEILAIMLDLLQTGFVKVDAGTPDEVYVWPYFAEKSVTTLTAPEKVELLRIVTAGDFADMQEYGNYNFYRIGITPDGQWKFFTGGD